MTAEHTGDDGTVARFFPYLDAHVQLVIEDGQVVSVTFPEHPDADAGDAHPLLDRLETYLSGTASDDLDDIPVATADTNDAEAVLTAVRAIPYGEARSVDELLAELPTFDPANEDDLALLREILAENPTPLVVPDHRVSAAPSGAPPRIEQRLRSLERIVT